ncbi:hypothetical protein H6F77_21100 [Microcoleus sp. FACHB-831]|uniref:hypothetical protein n=1 Tax=Microcoleus sp. FACHB-831 TaxID=2692827 RepID=UPI001682E5BF|nr:hypothetical protein [Microcoleus sp. FACHB-831]MBD1923549.1 hypothetical protein [Microcoleus sp. FACHB-831]
MATIFASPPEKMAISPELLVRESKITPQLQSNEGRQLADITETVWQHLSDRTQLLRIILPDTEEISYRPMPPKRSFTVRVRYHLQGRGEPLPYPLDDE